MSRVSNFFISINHLIDPLLRSRFHWPLSTKLAILRYAGRKSGKRFETPVAYHDLDGQIFVALVETSGRNWWRNFREPWPMELLIKGQWVSGTAVLIDPASKEYASGFDKLMRSELYIPPIFGIRYDRRQGLSEKQVASLARRSWLVHFQAGQ